jgi:putative DNA primase/helicase
MIDPRHIKEWVEKSGIDPEIANTNIQSITDKIQITNLIGWDKWIYPFGGWWVQSLSLLTFDLHPKFGQFKPDRPIELNKKFSKYLTPTKDNCIYDAIALINPTIPNYWQQVLSGDRPVVITEGAKKAAAFMSCGYAAIALCGVDMWQYESKFVDNLKVLVDAKKNFIIAFDQDTNPKSIVGVHNALKRLGSALRKSGCEVHVTVWDNALGKGIDDVLVAHGKEKVREIVDSSISYADFANGSDRLITDTRHQQVNIDVEPSTTTDPSDDFNVGLDCTNSTFDREIYQACFSDINRWRVLNQSFYRYTGKGYWQIIQEDQLENLFALKAERSYRLHGKDKVVVYIASAKLVDSAINYCRSRLFHLASEPNNHLLAFKNGTLDLSTNQLVAHSPDHNLTYCIDSDYIPGQECPPVFKDFLESAFEPDTIPLVRAFTGMYLDPTMPYGYFAHLMGGQGSGKGVLAGVWASFFTGGATRTLGSFEDLTTPEKRQQNLAGVTLGVFDDVAGYITKLQPFYTLVQNASLSGRLLYKSTSFERVWGIRFVVCSVKPLTIENTNEGWDRRCVILPLNSRNSSVAPDTELGQKLQSEKAQIISWALAMNKGDRIAIIQNPPSASTEASQESEKFGDPIRQFADMCLRPCDDKEGSNEITGQQLHDAFKQFCLHFGYNPTGYIKFISHLATVIPDCRIKATTQRIMREVVKSPAKWINLDFAPGCLNYEGNLIKKHCNEGGLIAFMNFSVTLRSGVTLTESSNQNHKVTATAIDKQGLQEPVTSVTLVTLTDQSYLPIEKKSSSQSNDPSIDRDLNIDSGQTQFIKVTEVTSSETLTTTDVTVTSETPNLIGLQGDSNGYKVTNFEHGDRIAVCTKGGWLYDYIFVAYDNRGAKSAAYSCDGLWQICMVMNATTKDRIPVAIADIRKDANL